MRRSLTAIGVFTLSALALATQARADALPPLHSNSELYRVATPPAATGRSGNAKLAARALRNKNGTTDVDVTTGALDSTAKAPGNISKLQVKTYNGNGDVEWTKNYNGLTAGGSLHYNYPDLHRGQPFQVQTNVDGIDKRTDVVTVSGNVKLRPDVAVKAIVGPDKARVNTAVNLSGTIAEVNGEVGAKTDCQLFIDGTQVDQALGIYVDAGRTVSCAFSYTFSVTGTHTLKVTAANVVPADYDLSNNSATASIQIVSASAPVYYYSGAGQYTYTRQWANSGWYRNSDGTYANGNDWSDTGNDRQTYQWDYLTGNSPITVQFPLTHFGSTEASDGTQVFAQSYDGLNADWTYNDGAGASEGCVSRWDNALYTYNYLCTQNWYGYQFTGFHHERYAGDVTYFSQGFQNQWWSYYGDVYSTYYYTWNYDYASSYGSFLPMGSTYNVSVNIEDAQGVSLQASADITLTPYSYGWGSPDTTCSDYSWTWGAEHYCSQYQYSEAGITGYTAGQTN